MFAAAHQTSSLRIREGPNVFPLRKTCPKKRRTLPWLYHKGDVGRSGPRPNDASEGRAGRQKPRGASKQPCGQTQVPRRTSGRARENETTWAEQLGSSG